jgi:hypothetical protein
MFAISVAIFVTGLIGTVFLLVAGGPMARASERQYGLALARDSVKKLRGERGALNAQLVELEGRKQELTASLQSMQDELKQLAGKIARLPKQTYELTFELGAPDAGLQPFEFMLSRNPGYLDVERVVGPERQLWQHPRVLRVWSRNLNNGMAMADKRYSIQNGFTVRAALRVDGAGSQPVTQG